MSTPTIPDVDNLDFAESQGVYCDEIINMAQWVLNQTNGVEVAKATTTGVLALDTSSSVFAVSGTENLTAITGRTGGQVLLRFTEARTIVHNAATLILPTGRDIAVIAGDVALVGADASGNWRCYTYQHSADIKLAGSLLYTFFNATTPEGYLACDGAAISRATYAALFSKIGTIYGAGNGSTTFNVPDMRGQFIRCLDNRVRTVGSAETDAFKSHYHTTSITAYSSKTAYSGVGVVTADAIFATSTYNSDSVGATETRPKNIALHTLIKY